MPTNGAREIVEGRARIACQSEAGQVFYNPKMSLNRDLAILFVKSYFDPQKQIRIADPMTASGVRAARYLLECSNVEQVECSDINRAAVDAAHQTARLNGLDDRMVITEGEANNLLLRHATTRRLDLVDLDPFGSPAPFFEGALRATSDRGILAATATDMAPLTGARSAACFRKYNVVPVRTEFEKEIAVRILVASLAFASGRLELGVRVVFSHASEHYARVYVEVEKGRRSANNSARNIGFIDYCPTCLRRDPRGVFEEFQLQCEDCASKKKPCGPIWLGPLWDNQVVQRMNEHAGAVDSPRLTVLQRTLGLIEQEASAPAFYHRVDATARSLRSSPPKLKNVLRTLAGCDFTSAQTHFHPNGFRTNAPDNIVRSIVSDLAKKT